jgi:Holliday junction DNA helicase RuvA
MIAQLTGTVAWVADTSGYLVVDVQGVGYKVSVPVSVLVSLPPVGQPLTLIIRTLVREDDIALYGFTNQSELRVFDLLLTVSGVGPKVAMGLLSALPAGDLANAVATGDVRTLTKVPGVGAKTAQRMVLELKEKLSAMSFDRRLDSGGSAAHPRKKDDVATVGEDVVSALLNLGYNKTEAQRAAEASLDAATRAGTTPDFAGLLRSSLGRLTGGK